MKETILFLIIIFITSPLHSQIIPDSMRVDWTHAGYEGIIPDPLTILSVTDYGAIANDGIDDDASITTAMNALNGLSGVLYFPAGVYDFGTTINLLDSVVLRGAGSDSTTLDFNFANNGGDAIRIWKGQDSSFVDVLSGYQKGSVKLVVASASSFSIGNYAELKETNGAWNIVPAFWAVDCVGQIVQITNIIGDSLFLDEALRIDYNDTLQPQIRVFTPITHAGIECLKILRADSVAPIVSYNISFLCAANCWVNGVESDHAIGAHVNADLSTHITISGCYFHHAYEYDGVSTHGYGVTLIQHTGDCLIENNFFRHLRHAMMVKQGANGNVFAYNYSIEPTRTEVPTDLGGDISVHGHYPFANLFEGNIVQTLYIDQTWGPGGPYNTFFRNREDLYGIIITQGNVITDKNNFVGNEITNSLPFHGLYLISGNNHFLWGNNRQGAIDPAGTDSLPDDSYYYSSLPNFWTGGIIFPPIGIPNMISSNSIPAKERFLNGGLFTQCGLEIPTSNEADVANDRIGFSVFPNPFNSQIHIVVNQDYDSKKIQATLFDVEGNEIYSSVIDVSSSPEDFTLSIPNNILEGCYLLRLLNGEMAEVIKVMKE